jgi:hypothetical protein
MFPSAIGFTTFLIFFFCIFTDPTPMTFYTTSETLLQSINSSSSDYEVDTTEAPNTSQENIQDNTVDSSKMMELIGESMSDSSMSGPTISEDYSHNISLKLLSSETNNEEGNDREELPKGNTEVYTENTSTGETSKTEESDKKKLHKEDTEVYTKSTGTGETSKTEGSATQEVQEDNSEVYEESNGSGETSKREENKIEELQKDGIMVHTESKGAGQANMREESDKEDLQQDNTKVYTESESSGETTKGEENNKEELQEDNNVVYAEIKSSGETTKGEENNIKELQQDNTEVYTESEGSGETTKREENNKEELQDNTKVYRESTGTGETSRKEENVKLELQKGDTEEDIMDISSEKMKNGITETWTDETITVQNHLILDSEGANNNSIDEEAYLSDATTTVIYPSDDKSMVRDSEAVWYVADIMKSSTETSQETVWHEITTNTNDDENGGSGTEPMKYVTTVSSREGSGERTVTESTGGSDNSKSITSSGETGQHKYDEDNTAKDISFQNSSTTTGPDEHTQSTENEPRDTVPVITFQNDMESHYDMGIVLPDLDNNQMQVDYDIKKTETDPVVGKEGEINTSLEYSSTTNNSTAGGQNTSKLGHRIFQNSNEESEATNTDESTPASFTTTPTSEVTSEFKTSETVPTTEYATDHSETVYITKIQLSVASLLMHHSPTEAQSVEFSSPIYDSTTPDILEGEHPLNSEESKQKTENTAATATEKLQDVTAANSLSDRSNIQESKTETYISNEGIPYSEPVTESFTESVGNTASSDNTETSTYLTTDTTEPSERILAAAIAFKSNKTTNTFETNTEVIRLEADESQTSRNEDKGEEFSSEVNYSLDKSKYSYESKSRDKNNYPEGIDIMKSVQTTESMFTTSNSFEITDKFNENHSQTLGDEFSNVSQTTVDTDTDSASEEMAVMTGEHGTSTTSSYSLQETEMPFWQNSFTQHIEEHNNNSNNNSNIIPQDKTEDSRLSGSDDGESWNSNADKIAGAKQPNNFDKIYPESLSTEDKSTDYERHATDESVLAKEVKSAIYSSSSYEVNFHDIYGIGDYYVASSESVLADNITDLSGETTTTVTSPSSEEQSAELTTVRSRSNESKERYSQQYVDVDTTVRPTESATTNKTESALKSTTPGLLETFHNSEEVTEISEIKVHNSVEEGQDAYSQDTKLENENSY